MKLRIPSLSVAYKIAKALDTSINGLFSDDIINKYYELPEEDKETINRMIESLYEKKLLNIRHFDGYYFNSDKNDIF